MSKRLAQKSMWYGYTICYADSKCEVYGNICSVKIRVRADGKKVYKKVVLDGDYGYGE